MEHHKLDLSHAFRKHAPQDSEIEGRVWSSSAERFLSTYVGSG